MARFKDAKKRDWDVVLTRGDLRRVREATRIELGRLLADRDQLAAVVFGDPEALWAVLWVLLEPQAKERGVTAEDLEDAWDRDAAQAAVDALVVAVADFTLPRGTAGAVAATVRSGKAKAEAAMAARATLALAAAEAEMDARLTASTTSSGSAPSSPASPVSPTGG